MNKLCRIVAALVAVGLARHALAWHDEGHAYVALAAVRALPPELPVFLREGAVTIAHCAIDPDLHGDGSIAISRDAEAPNHYIDLEMLQGRPLPPTRHQFIKLCQELNVEPGKVGYLPWTIEEWTQRLAMGLAEHRKWPDNPHIQAKLLVYAGLLAHYAGDLHNPLHTSVHFDGRVSQKPDGAWTPSPRSGIHAKTDALPTKLPFNVIFPIDQPLDVAILRELQLTALIRQELAASHALVDRVYNLEPKLPPVDLLQLDDADIRAFTIDRQRAAAAFLAKLYIKAWELSANLADKNLAPPYWLDRDTFDSNLDPNTVPLQPAPAPRKPVQLTP